MRLLMASLIVALCALPAQAIVLGQVDTFDSGQGVWQAGLNLTVPANGGPLGAGDPFLKLTSDANSFDLGMNTKTRWSGDYVSAGAGAISADLRNFGSTPLEIRVYLMGVGTFTSTQAFTLPADQQWHHAVFNLTPTDLTWVGEVNSLDATLRDADVVGFRHQSGAPLPPYQRTPILSSFGIDNITALPEPASLVLGLVGCAFAWRRR